MNDLFDIFGEASTKELIDGLYFKPQYDGSIVKGATFYVENKNDTQTTYESDLKQFESINEDYSTSEDLIEKINKEIHYLKENTNQLTDINISSPLKNIIIKLGTLLYDKAATNEKINKFENDFWFVRLRDLIKKDFSKTRKQFMRLATNWYILIEIEGYSEQEVIDELVNDKSKMADIIEKRNVKQLADFIEKVHYIASTKQIEHFIKIIKTSSASEEVQQELIEKLFTENILDTWEN